MGKAHQALRTDSDEIFHKSSLPLQKGKVTRAPSHTDDNSAFHQVYVKLHNDESSQRMPVIMGNEGDAAIPHVGDNVLVAYGANDKPFVLGSWYPIADENGNSLADEVPKYDPGDRVVGNDTGSYVKIRDDGRIKIITEGYERVDMDRHTAVTYRQSSQSIPGDDNYYTVDFDTEIEDSQDLFDPSTHSVTLRHEGMYTVIGSVIFPTPGQNNRFESAVFVNGSERHRSATQSVVNNEIGVKVVMTDRFDAGDTIDIRVKQDSGSSKNISGGRDVSEFSIRRHGI